MHRRKLNRDRNSFHNKSKPFLNLYIEKPRVREKLPERIATAGCRNTLSGRLKPKKLPMAVGKLMKFTLIFQSYDSTEGCFGSANNYSIFKCWADRHITQI